MANGFGVGVPKIENWYKHHRRSLAKRGQFDIKTKKHFKNSEVSYLMEILKEHPKPTLEQIKIAAEELNCTDYQIKNWFSNKRKKLKFLIQDPEVPLIEIIQQTDHQLAQDLNPVSNLSTSDFQTPSSHNPSLSAYPELLGCQMDVNSQHLRAQLANFPQSTLPSNQEISRLQGIQGRVCPPNFFGPWTSLPFYSVGTNLNNEMFRPAQDFSNISSRLNILQAEARSALDFALRKHAFFMTQQQLNNFRNI